MKKFKSTGNKKTPSKKVNKEVPRIISMMGQHEKKLEKELANFVDHIVQLKKEKARIQKKSEKMKTKGVTKYPYLSKPQSTSSVKHNQAKSNNLKSNSNKASQISTFKKKTDHLKLVSKDPSTTHKK